MLLGHLAAHLCTHASPRAGEVLTDRASVSSRLWPDQLGSSRRSKSPYLEAEAVAVSHPPRCALARLWISVRYAELSPLPPGGGGPGTAASLSFLRCQRGMDSGPPPSATRKRGLVDAVFQKLVGDRFGSVPSHTLMRLLQVRRSAFRASSQRGWMQSAFRSATPERPAAMCDALLVYQPAPRGRARVTTMACHDRHPPPRSKCG